MNLNNLLEQTKPAKLLAVSKFQSTEKIKSLYLQGQRLFAENYAQEALTKQQELTEFADIEWHFIGHLQKNKLKMIAGHFALIHSMDSIEKLQSLDKICEQKNIIQKVLIQINIANEESKGGFSVVDIKKFWPQLLQLKHLKIMGLMTMTPLTENPQSVRPYFRELRLLKEELRTTTDLAHHPLSELSMGTSHDFVTALEEGATIVRLGTILFGERSPRG